MKNPVVESFSEFYEKWVWKLEEIHHQLLEMSKKKTEIQVINEQELQTLVSRVTSHLKEYYTVKWASAHEDVLVFFSPPWLSPLENAYLWVTGWKPSTAFKLLESLKKKKAEKEGEKEFEMTEEQERKIEELRMKIRMEEEKVEREMERQQVAMADRKMVEMAKISSRGRNNGDVVASSSQVALKGVFGGLVKVMKASDCVRLKTLKGLLDLLTPMQCVLFLAAIIAMHLRLRQWGKNRDVPVNEEKLLNY